MLLPKKFLFHKIPKPIPHLLPLPCNRSPSPLPSAFAPLPQPSPLIIDAIIIIFQTSSSPIQISPTLDLPQIHLADKDLVLTISLPFIVVDSSTSSPSPHLRRIPSPPPSTSLLIYFAISQSVAVRASSSWINASARSLPSHNHRRRLQLSTDLLRS